MKIRATRSMVGSCLAGLSVMLVATIALAGTTAVIDISSPAGAPASLTFTGRGSCSTTTTQFDFPDPATDASLTNTCSSGMWPGCGGGSFSQNSTTQWSDSATANIGGPIGCKVILTPTTTSQSTGSFDTTTLAFTWDPQFTFVATSDVSCSISPFTCDSSNVVAPTIDGTLALSGTDYKGIITVSTSSSKAPAFTTTSNCPASVASTLNCYLGDLTSAYLEALYAP